MASTITAALNMSMSASLISSAFGNLTPALNKLASLAAGSAASQIDQCCFKEITIVNTGTPTDVDLVGGGLLQPDGSTFAPARITGIGIVNTSSAQILTIGGSPSNPFINWLLATGDGIKIGKSGHFSLVSPVDGYTLAGGASDILRFAVDGGTNILAYLALFGRSA